MLRCAGQRKPGSKLANATVRYMNALVETASSAYNAHHSQPVNDDLRDQGLLMLMQLLGGEVKSEALDGYILMCVLLLI